MPGPLCERAIADALESGNALLKFISPNDAGATGSHQCGFYLPHKAWRLYSPAPPQDGVNFNHQVTIRWQDEPTTRSVISWYGQGTNHEFRLTRFGRGFPHFGSDAVGNMLVLVPQSIDRFNAYILESEEDIEELQAALGIEVHGRWGILARDGAVDPEAEASRCIERHSRAFAEHCEDFPPGEAFALAAREALDACVPGYRTASADTRLTRAIEAEYEIFRKVEERICLPMIRGPFSSIGQFLSAAAPIMNRRKVRAGRSLERHVELILRDAGIPFEAQPAIDGRPDLVIPSVKAYNDPTFPEERLFIVAMKTTCKDRWLQILREGRRVRRKHLITLQQGISSRQIREMLDANVVLITPESLHKFFERDSRSSLMSVERFMTQVRVAAPR